MQTSTAAAQELIDKRVKTAVGQPAHRSRDTDAVLACIGNEDLSGPDKTQPHAQEAAHRSIKYHETAVARVNEKTNCVLGNVMN